MRVLSGFWLTITFLFLFPLSCFACDDGSTSCPDDVSSAPAKEQQIRDLSDGLFNENVPQLRRAIAEEMVGRAVPDNGPAHYGKLSTSTDAELRQQAIDTLTYLNEVSDEVNAEVDEALASALQDQDDVVRCLASGVLKIQKFKTKKSITKLQKKLRGDDFWVQIASGYLLEPLGATAVDGVPELLNVAVEDRSPSEKFTAWVMRMVQGQLKGMVPGLMELVLANRGGAQCEGSLKSLAGQKNLNPDQLIDMLDDEHSCLRRYATFLLGFMGRDSTQVVAVIGRCLQNENSAIVSTISSALSPSQAVESGYSLKKSETARGSFDALTDWAVDLKSSERQAAKKTLAEMRRPEVQDQISAMPKLSTMREKAEESFPVLRSLFGRQ